MPFNVFRTNTKHTSIFEFLKNNIYVILLILIASFICYKNYVPNTFLTGWDTLHPEFNFPSYWNRIINGAWQSHQGLGAVNTQAHASEIPRILFLMLLSLIFKLSDIRYIYAFLMLIIGPLGVYYYVKKIFLADISSKASSFGAFCAGIFYLLNLGTLQHFYVPLEMFLTHYGFLGWSFLVATNFFERNTKKDYFWFILINIILTSQAHTPTLFYTYFLSMLLYFGALSLVEITRTRSLFSNFKRLFSVLFTILLLNSFWLLPSSYFLLTKSREIQESKIHHLFSDEAFLSNAAFGTIDNVAILKGFLFDWGEYIGNNKFGQILNEWQSYYFNNPFYYMGYAFFVMILGGILVSLFRKYPYWLGILAIMAVSILFLFSINPPFGFVIEFLLTKLPLLKEILRFPFTKFSILIMFSYAVFFGSFWGFFATIFDKISQKVRFGSHIYLISTLFILFAFYSYMKPAFDGNLISPSMKVAIPSRYFEMFSYINSQKEYGRVANLPLNSFWGWVYYSWNDLTQLGYQGAGFLWFGIERPLIDREFDRWNIANEQVYRELSYAVYNQDVKLLENTLEKYKIRWLLFDDSILAPGNVSTVLFLPETKNLLYYSNKIFLEKDFGQGLYLYRYQPTHEFYLKDYNVSYSKIGNTYFREYVDFFYNNFGNYIYSENVLFPLIGNTDKDENLVDSVLSSDDKNIYIEATSLVTPVPLVKVKPSVVAQYPEFSVFKLGTNLYSKEDIINSPFDSTKITTLEVYSGSNLISLDIFPVLEACSESTSEGYYSLEKLSTGFTIKSQDIRACVTFNLAKFSELNARTSNIFTLSGVNLDTKDLCIYDEDSHLCISFDLEDRLYAYLDKPLNKYSIRISSDSYMSPFDNALTIKDIKAGWLSTPKVEDTSIVSLPFNQDGTIVFSKDLRYSNYVTDMSNNARLCAFSAGDLGDSTVTYLSDSLKYTSPNQSLCDTFFFHSLDHESGYILEIKSKNVSGVPLRVCLTNEVTKRCDAYFSLPQNSELKSNYYLIPPFSKGVGYTLNISNMVFGNIVTTNELSYVSFTPVDYNFIKNIYIGDISTVTNKNNLFVYNEAFDPGWLAFCEGELCKAKHVKVNNWSNGWAFEGPIPDNIKVVFWPQYLEYGGFALLLIPLIGLFKRK